MKKYLTGSLVVIFFIAILVLMNFIRLDLRSDNNQSFSTNTSTGSSLSNLEIATYALEGLSDRYPHGALGDDFEPTILLKIEDNGSKSTLVSLPSNQVFETNRLLLEDITGDEIPEVLVTVSDANLGAANFVYDLNGVLIAQTEFIGTTYRWRHLIGVMENESGEKFLVDVVRPHLDATLNLYELQRDKLVSVYSKSGYPSHQYGSEKLDLATISSEDGRDILRIPNEDGNDHFLYIERNSFVLLDK